MHSENKLFACYSDGGKSKRFNNRFNENTMLNLFSCFLKVNLRLVFCLSRLSRQFNSRSRSCVNIHSEVVLDGHVEPNNESGDNITATEWKTFIRITYGNASG